MVSGRSSDLPKKTEGEEIFQNLACMGPRSSKGPMGNPTGGKTVGKSVVREWDGSLKILRSTCCLAVGPGQQDQHVSGGFWGGETSRRGGETSGQKWGRPKKINLGGGRELSRGPGQKGGADRPGIRLMGIWAGSLGQGIRRSGLFPEMEIFKGGGAVGGAKWGGQVVKPPFVPPRRAPKREGPQTWLGVLPVSRVFHRGFYWGIATFL